MNIHLAVLAVHQKWLKPKIKLIHKEIIKLEQIKTKAATENDKQNLFHSVHHGDKCQCQFYIKIAVAALLSVNLQFYKTSYLMNNYGYTSPASNGLNYCSAGLLIRTDGHWDRL